MGNFSTRKQCFQTLFALTIVVSLSAPVGAVDRLEELAKQVGVRILVDATSDKSALELAKSQIPYGKMSESAQQRAADLVASSSQYRRMPCLQYEVDPNIYQYLVNHPDVAISTWRVMGISKLDMNQTGEFEYEAKSTDGSEGIADVLWRDANQCLFIVEGSYKSPLLPTTIHASALVWLRYRFVESNDGKTLVNQQVETFLYFPSGAVDAIARMATTVTNTILDRNVFEVSLYARMMSRASETEPEWIEQLAHRMDGVLPQRRMELIQIARGRKPAAGRMLPTASSGGAVTGRMRRLPQSGEFRQFETSLHTVNTHVPLIAAEVKHEPSYGQKIGETNAWMKKPYEYTPVEARKALAEKEARATRTQAYNAFYANPAAKGVPQVMSPAGVPPVDEVVLHDKPQAKMGAIMTSPKTLSLPEYTRSHDADVKASYGTPLLSPMTTGRTTETKSVRVKSGSGPINRTKTVSSRKIQGPTSSSKPTQTGPAPVAASPGSTVQSDG